MADGGSAIVVEDELPVVGYSTTDVVCNPRMYTPVAGAAFGEPGELVEPGVTAEQPASARLPAMRISRPIFVRQGVSMCLLRFLPTLIHAELNAIVVDIYV